MSGLAYTPATNGNGTAYVSFTFQVEDDGISRNHARIRADTNRAWVEDLGSRNGTQIRGAGVVSGTVDPVARTVVVVLEMAGKLPPGTRIERPPRDQLADQRGLLDQLRTRRDPVALTPK